MFRFLLVSLALSMAGAAADDLTLSKKAAVFQHDMEARFLLDGQALCKLLLPGGDRDFVAYNMPDNAYMTGIYLGTLSMKYAVTKDSADRAAARKSLEALHLLCTVSGEPGLLARAAWPVDRPMLDDGQWRTSADGKYKWRGDVSSDQVDGVMFGYSLAFDLVADDAEKALIAADVVAMVDHILANDLRIVDVDGKPTQWGRYFPAYVRFERLNALLWLQALKVAAHVTGDSKYADAYRRYALDEKYAQFAVKARNATHPAIRGAVNHSDDVLVFLGTEPLLRLETDEALKKSYVESWQHSWVGQGRYPALKNEANPMYSFLAAKYLGDDSSVKAAIDTLRWFPFDMKWNRDTIAKYEKELGFTFDPAPKSPESPANTAVPIDRREKTWSAWVQDPYHSTGPRTADERIEYNGHDYLLGYWMGRHLGYIGADE